MSSSSVPFQETWERWTTRATSQLAPIKEKLRNTATQVAGIADTMQELEDDSRQLALKVTWVTQVILERIPPDGPADERAKEVVLALATKVSKIDAFLRSGRKKGDMTGKRAKKVSKYHKSLDALRLQPSLVDIPPTPEAFHGRDEVVGSIVQLLLQDKPSRVPVLGTGGIGKTSVAVAAMNDEQVKERYGEHMYFLSCEGIDSEEGLVNALAVFFKIQRDSNIRTSLIAHLSSLGRALLTLDNFETTTQSDRQRVRELLGRIGRVPSLSLIITMRGTQPAQGLSWDTMTRYGDCGPLLRTSIATLRRSKDTDGSGSSSNGQGMDSMNRAGEQEKHIAQCLLLLGNILLGQSRYKEAATILTEGRAAFEAISDRLGAAQCVQSVGDMLRMQCRYEEAAALLTEARAALETIPHRFGAAECVRGLGDILRMQCRYEEAAAVLTEARAAFEAIPDPVGAAQCLLALADILYVQCRYEEAAALLTKARGAFEAIPYRLGAAQCAQLLGETMRMQSQYEEAAALFTEGKAEFNAIAGRLGAAACSQYTEALSMLREAEQAVPGTSFRQAGPDTRG
ncbi:TPR-like protein [Dacryopinax primogenitus]|uniref:TPR-like protein n=1 Tax=Dacryopinax primogenitus (strain DJM 731) TaxID=1858805 RepID=M5G250_DACPD|nr:TPR-like protein [Dacryopinax primogenitus]EJU02769.1 TPR-like protein [Dacryopinax primogenitus]